MRTKEEKLLREYVRKSILSEDEAGGNPALFGGGGVSSYDAGFMTGGSGAYGGGAGGDLIDTFVTPFVDVFKTAVGKTKEITRKTRTLLWVSLQTVLTTLIPFYGYKYAEVFDKEKEDIEKIRNEYKDVYDRTEEALNTPEAGMLAFMASPGLVLGALAAKSTPAVTKELFSTLSGGLTDDIYDGIKDKAEKLGRWTLGDDDDDSSRRRSRSRTKSKRDPKDFFGESQINEEEKQDASGKKKLGPKDVLKSKKMISAVLDSPKVKEMQKKASETYKATLESAYSEAEETLKKTKTIEDIEKTASESKAKGSAEIKKKVEELKKLPPEEKKKAEDMLIKGIRKSTKEFYVKGLEDRVKAVVDSGIPAESDFVKDHKAVIQKIKSL